MSTLRVTVTKIGGAIVEPAHDMFRRWRKSQASQLALDLPIEVKSEILGLLECIDEACESPPILYHQQYVDNWSVAMFLIESATGRMQPKPITIYLSTTANYTTSFIRIRNRRACIKSLIDQRRKRSYRNEQERRWFVDALVNAVSSYENVSKNDKREAVIIVCKSVNTSWSDSEISRAMAEPAPWLGAKSNSQELRFDENQKAGQSLQMSRAKPLRRN